MDQIFVIFTLSCLLCISDTEKHFEFITGKSAPSLFINDITSSIKASSYGSTNLAHAYTIYSLPESKPPFKRTVITDNKRIDTQKLVDVVYQKNN